jgi:hypothetical protein
MPFLQKFCKTNWNLFSLIYLPSSNIDILFKYLMNITYGIELPLHFTKFSCYLDM